MQGEIHYFRKRVFGGFNREDVVAYIAQLSKERNEAVEALSEAEKEIEKLKGELRQQTPPQATTTTPPPSKSKKVIVIKKSKKRSEHNGL